MNLRICGYARLRCGCIGAKHLQAYLDEMCFRFDNRKNPFLFRDTLLKLLQTEHLEHKELIAA